MDTILALDQKISLWFNSFTGQAAWIDTILKFIALWFVYIIPLTLIGFWFLYGQKEKLIALRVTLFGLVGWLVVNNLIGLVWFRKRPFIKLTDTQELIFHQPDKSFPSDHATLGFALAIGFTLAGYKKLGYFFLIWTVIFSIARVIVGVHFPLDAIAGFIVGGAIALGGHWLQKPFDRYVGKPLVEVAKAFHLA